MDPNLTKLPTRTSIIKRMAAELAKEHDGRSSGPIPPGAEVRSSDSNDPRYIQEYDDGTSDIKFPGRKGDPTQAAFKILKAKAKTELEGLKERNALILSNDNSIYDELVMCCTGKALTVVQTVKTRSGFAAWHALVLSFKIGIVPSVKPKSSAKSARKYTSSCAAYCPME